MRLEANTEGHYVSVSAADDGYVGYVDAGVSGELAGLELATKGTLRVDSSESMRPNVLSISMSRTRLREVGLVALEKSGAPAFTASEWLEIAQTLESIHGGERIDDYARQIRDGYLR